MIKDYFRIITFLKHTKVLNFDVITNENNVQHNSKWPIIPDHPP